MSNLALVTSDGRYHGHFEDEIAARAGAAKLAKSGASAAGARILNRSEWDKVAALSDEDRVAGKREQLCRTLGKAL